MCIREHGTGSNCDNRKTSINCDVIIPAFGSELMVSSICERIKKLGNWIVTLETPGAGVASVLKTIVSDEDKFLEDRPLLLPSALIFIDHKPLAPATA